MKKVFIRISLFTMFLCSFAFVHAQMQMPSAADRAAKMTDWMKTNLSLTDAQLPQIQALNLKYASMMDSLKNSTSDQATKMNAMKADNTAKDAEVKGILTDSQYQTYLAKEAEMKEKYKDKMKANGMGSGSGQ